MNVDRIDDYDADDYDANDDDDDDDYSDDDDEDNDDHDDDDDGGKTMIIESINIRKIVFLDDCMSSMIIITMKGCDSSIDNMDYNYVPEGLLSICCCERWL